MVHTTINPKAFSTRQRKIDWLVRHHDLWQGKLLTYGKTDHVAMAIIRQMKMAGLVSPKTYHLDVRLKVLITAAKLQIEKAA